MSAGTAAALAGCAPPGNRLVPAPTLNTGEGRFDDGAVPPQNRATAARLFFVTDRAPIEEGFGSQRSRSIRYGEAIVRIGDDRTDWLDIVNHSNGASRRLELNLQSVTTHGVTPASPLPFKVVNGRAVPLPEVARAYDRAQQDLSARISAALAANETDEVLLLVPGANTSFEDGAFPLSDIWHHSGRRMLPILYSWPSGSGGLLGYFTDRESGEFTVFHLKEFLRVLARTKGLRRTHLIAHSRGTDVATTALRELVIEARAKGQRPKRTLKIENLILAAPDLDFDIVGQRLVAEQFGLAFGRITVYTNRQDSVLRLAQRLMQGTRFGRLRPEDISDVERVIFGNVERVNFIRVEDDGSAFGHGYYRNNPNVLSDIILVMRTCAPPGTATRPLEQLAGNFWRLPKTYLQSGMPVLTSCPGRT